MGFRWFVSVLGFLGLAACAQGQTTSGTTTLPQAKTPDYFGPSLTQTFNDKALFPNATSILPGTTNGGSGSGAASGNTGWNPLGTPPVGGLGGLVELPTTLLPDESLPPPPPPKIWAGGLELGLNGSQGNADVLSIRAGGQGDRKTPDNLFHFDLLYTLTQTTGPANQNQALFNARDEILFKGTAWSLFSALQVEYDQFRAYDFRVGAYDGFSYRWVKTDNMLFKTRLGAGAVREIDTTGQSRDRWVPEAVMGFDFNRRVNDRQSFVSSMDLYPNLSQIGQYRVRARAGYEIVIDPAQGMILRLGLQDRYDTLPAQSKRNDFNYFTTVMFRF